MAKYKIGDTVRVKALIEMGFDEASMMRHSSKDDFRPFLGKEHQIQKVLDCGVGEPYYILKGVKGHCGGRLLWDEKSLLIPKKIDPDEIKIESVKALKQLKHLLGWENMWVTKEDDLYQYVYQCKPYKVADAWNVSDGDFVDILHFPYSLDFIKSTDEEPFEVE